MAGNLFGKDRAAAVVLSSSSASLSSGSAVLLPTLLDSRAASGGNAAGDFYGQFDLLAQWATITGIVASMNVAEIYLVPPIDLTNYADLDLTAGSSRIPYAFLFGVFEAPKAPTASTNMRFGTPRNEIAQRNFRVYLKNTSGQSMAAGWTLTALTDQGQYS